MATHDTLDRRARILFPVLAMLVAVLPVLPALARPDGVLASRHSDVLSEAYPKRAFIAGEVEAHGRIPGWNPVAFAGLPAIGSFSIPLFYPPFLPLLLTKSPWLFTLQFALHLAWMALGMYLLSRRLAASRPAAFLAATMFVLSARVSGHLYAGHMTLITELAWIPWALWLADGLSERIGRALPLSLVLGAILMCGHVQIYHYTVLVVGLWTLAAAWGTPTRRGPALTRAALSFGAAVALSLVVAAAQLVPSYLLSREAGRAGGVSLDFASSYALDPLNLIALVIPMGLGHAEAGTYWGPPNYWERCAAIGIPLLVLAVAGLLSPGRTRGRRFLGLLMLGAFLFSLGNRTPFFTLLFRLVPGLEFFRVPSRAMMFTVLAAALLAARGFDGISASRGRRLVAFARSVLPVLAVIAAVTAIVWIAAPDRIRGAGHDIIRRMYESDQGAEGHSRPLEYWLDRVNLAYRTLRTGLVALVILLAGLALALRLRLIGRIGPVGLVAALLALVIAENVFVSSRHLGWRSRSALERRSPIADALALEPGPVRVLDQEHALPVGPSMRAGIELVGGYDPTIPARYLEYAGGMIGKDRDPLGSRIRADRTSIDGTWRRWWLDDLSVRFVVSNDDLSKHGFSRFSSSERPDGFSDPVVWSNPRAAPRARLAGSWRPVRDLTEALRTMKASGPVRVLVVEGAPAPPRDAADGDVRWLRRESDRLRLETTSTGPGMLVVADAWSSGWRATVDGRPAEVLPANTALRAVLVPAGDHVVELRYDAPGLEAGLAASLLASSLLLAVWFLVSRRRSSRETRS